MDRKPTARPHQRPRTSLPGPRTMKHVVLVSTAFREFIVQKRTKNCCGFPRTLPSTRLSGIWPVNICAGELPDLSQLPQLLAVRQSLSANHSDGHRDNSCRVAKTQTKHAQIWVVFFASLDICGNSPASTLRRNYLTRSNKTARGN